jgi:pyruvate kinase
MPLPDHKTKIVATVGPPSESKEMLERLIHVSMSITRINFLRSDFIGHAATPLQ